MVTAGVGNLVKPIILYCVSKPTAKALGFHAGTAMIHKGREASVGPSIRRIRAAGWIDPNLFKCFFA